MKLRYKLLSVGVIVGIVVGWLHFKHPSGSTLVGVIDTTGALQTPSNLHPSVDYGHGFKLVQKGNKVFATPKSIGFPFDVGVSIAGGGQSPQFYLTTEIFYYRHAEVLAGLGITWGAIVHPRAMVAIGYRLPYKRLDNLSLFVGATSAQEIIVGSYVRFGSN